MKSFLLTSIISFLVICSVSGQKLKAPKVLIKGKLDNGLTYYIYPNDKPEGEAVYRLFIKSGSLFETEKQRGLAHFLEHMAFNGTEHFPGNSLTGFLESKGAKFGADLNAHTSMNETVYKLQLPSSDPAFVDSTLMILADWAGGLLLDSTEVEDERGVILSEWLLKVGPKYEAQNAFLLELLNGSRYSKRLTIGDTAVIKNFPVKDLRDYYEKWYDPSIMAIAVAGDVDPKKTQKLIKKHFSHLKSTLNGELPSYSIPNYDQVAVKTVSHESLDGVQLSVVQLLDKPKAVITEKDYPAYLQRVLLNKLIGARFNDLLFDDPAYSKASYSYSSFMHTKGVLIGSVELTPTKIREGIVDFAKAAEQLFRYGFTQTEIEKVKATYINSLRREVESKESRKSSSLMREVYADFYVGNKIISAKDEYLLAKKYITTVDSLKLVNQLQEIRRPEQTHYMLTTFDKAKNEIPGNHELIQIFDSIRSGNIQPYSKNLDMPEDLLSNEPAPSKIVQTTHLDEIDAEQLLLPNGATVIFKQSSLSPNDIIFSGFRKGGLYAMDSTDYVSGLHDSRIIGLSGAGKFSREGLSQYLAGKSASMRFVIEKLRVGMVGGSNVEDLELMFRLFYLKWTQPRVDTATFALWKKEAIEKYQTRNVTPTTQFYEDLAFLIKGDNYVTKPLTDKRLEKELQLDRILPIYQKEFSSVNGFNFVIIGDCILKEIQPYIEKYIGSLPGGVVNSTYKYHHHIPVKKDTSFVRNVGDDAKSTVSLIFQSEDKIDNLNELSLTNDLTKDVIRNQLLEVLREEMGMVYSVSVSMGKTKYPSNLHRSIIRFSCKPEDVDTLIHTTMGQLKLLVENPESFQSALTDVKLNLIKNWELEKQKNIYWSRSIRDIILMRKIVGIT